MKIADQIQQLRDELRQHNHQYYILDAPTISDYEFDQKLKQLQDLEAAHPEFDDPNSPTQRVGGAITKNFIFVTSPHFNTLYSWFEFFSQNKSGSKHD